MKERNYWSMAALNDLLSDIATAGWSVRTLMYGTHSGDHNENPWKGPLACEVYVSGWRMPGPVTVADVNRLDEIVRRHGADLELSLGYAEERHGVATVGIGEWGERFLIDNYISAAT